MADKGGTKARLEAAVKRLETAIGHMTEFTGTEIAEAESLRQEVANLNLDLIKSQTENNRLSEQLRQAKSEYVDLQSAMDNITTRLDSVIDTVQTLLDDQPGT